MRIGGERFEEIVAHRRVRVSLLSFAIAFPEVGLGRYLERATAARRQNLRKESDLAGPDSFRE